VKYGVFVILRRNKIVVGLKGITWIHNRNENLRKAVVQGFEL
jgi:hypothetical protein